MEHIRLCDSEYRFMQVVWEAAPVNSGRLAALCRERLGWKKSTVYTVLKRLCDRGLLRNENSIVTALAEREAVDAEAAEDFVDRTFRRLTAGVSGGIYERAELDGTGG